MSWTTAPVRRLTSAAFGLTLLAGCAGAAPGPTLQDVVRTAALETARTGSSRVALTSTTAIGPQTVTFAGEGAFDYATNTGQLAFDVPGPGGPAAGGTIEQRMIGNDLFLMLPQQAGVYYRLLVSDVAGTSLGNSTDPTASLQALAGVDNVREVGVESVRGVETTHYTGEYDVAQAIEQAQGAARTILETTLGRTALPRVPFDAYLDEQGRMVKFMQRLELPPSDRTSGQPLLSSFTLELFDFGTPVTVVPPPAESVRDGAPLLAALQQARPTAPAPPGAPAPAEPPPVAPAPAEPPAPLPAPPAPPPEPPAAPAPPPAPPEPPAPPPAAPAPPPAPPVPAVPAPPPG